MMRTSILALVGLLMAGHTNTARADCMDATLTTAKLVAPRVQRSAPGDGGALLEPTPGSSFPVESADGSRIATLFMDEEDFSGAPVSTLVIWSRSGKRLASFRLGGAVTPVRPDLESPGEARTAYEQKLVDRANAVLAKSRWRSLATTEPCQVTFDPDTGDAEARVTGEAKPRRLRAAFPAPGRRTADGGGGTCGDVLGIETAIWAPKARAVILIPRVQLGGDSCIGELNADLAVLVRVR